MRRIVALVFLLAAAASVLAWSRRHSVRAALELTGETLPPHPPLTAIWWSFDETRAIAVGREGVILERTSAITEPARGRWEAIASPTNAALERVAGGWGPSRDGWIVTRPTRVFAVGEHGTLVDGSSRPWAIVPSGTEDDLHDVAVDGEQALVVGDHGALLHVASSDATTPETPAAALRIERVAIFTHANLRAVALTCAYGPRDLQCIGIAVGDSGTIVEGVGEGRCPDGHTVSGVQGHDCRWTWTPAESPTKDDLVAVWQDGTTTFATSARGALLTRARDRPWELHGDVPYSRGETRAPVHVTETHGFTRRVRASTARVGFGNATFAQVGDAWLAIEPPSEFIAGAAPNATSVDAALFLTKAGDVALAR